MAELDDLRSFVEVAGAGGFRRAASRLGVSKSIVSRRIARLEAELGTLLLSRTTRGVRPTEAGLEFKARAERVLADLDEARDAVMHQDDTRLVGRLRIAAPLGFGVRNVAPMLTDFALRHPELELDVSYSDRIVDLVGEGFDVALRIGALRDSSLVARRIAPVHAAVVASPAYLEKHGTPLSPEDLSRHECLLYSGATTPEWRFRAGKRWIAVRAQGRLRSDNGQALVNWAIAGLGVAALPAFECGEAVRAGQLTALLTEFPMPETALHVVRPPGPYTSRKVRALIDAAVERFSDKLWDPCAKLLAEPA
jgi:DNA-binding transcriptional LysR family regulator